MELKGKWTPSDIRDEVIDFVEKWKSKTNIMLRLFVLWLGISMSKFYAWRERYGMINTHNGKVPRDFWLSNWEKNSIIEYAKENLNDGYRRLSFMMLDKNIVAVSPTSVFRVLKNAGMLGIEKKKPSLKGTGFNQPDAPHKHWHVDISYVNLSGTFYYLCTILDGYSRYVVHYELRESMKEADVSTIIQRGLEKFPDFKPRIISDNGPQFLARDFKEFIRISGMDHVRTSPYYPQSNGKIERWHKEMKQIVRAECPKNFDAALEVIRDFVDYYNNERLHSALGYICPVDYLLGKAKGIYEERDNKLEFAREMRRQKYQEGKLKKNKKCTEINLEACV